MFAARQAEEFAIQQRLKEIALSGRSRIEVLHRTSAASPHGKAKARLRSSGSSNSISTIGCDSLTSSPSTVGTVPTTPNASISHSAQRIKKRVVRSLGFPRFLQEPPLVSPPASASAAPALSSALLVVEGKRWALPGDNSAAPAVDSSSVASSVSEDETAGRPASGANRKQPRSDDASTNLRSFFRSSPGMATSSRSVVSLSSNSNSNSNSTVGSAAIGSCGHQRNHSARARQIQRVNEELDHQRQRLLQCCKRIRHHLHLAHARSRNATNTVGICLSLRNVHQLQREQQNIQRMIRAFAELHDICLDHASLPSKTIEGMVDELLDVHMQQCLTSHTPSASKDNLHAIGDDALLEQFRQRLAECSGSVEVLCAIYSPSDAAATSSVHDTFRASSS